jgi:hypothetical protein
MSFLTYDDEVSLLKNLKMDRHRRLNIKDTKFTTPQHTCEEWPRKTRVKNVNLLKYTGYVMH